MHKSISDLFNKDGSQRPGTDEILNGLNVKDREKPLTESNKKLVNRVLNLIDSGTPTPDAIKQAKEEVYPQSASAIAVVEAEPGSLAQVTHDAARSIDPETMNLAKATFQQESQREMIGAVVESITVYPPAIGDSVRGEMLESLKDPAFVAETNAKIKEAIAGALKK